MTHPTGLDPARLDRIQPWMQGWVDSGRIVGMSTMGAPPR